MKAAKEVLVLPEPKPTVEPKPRAPRKSRAKPSTDVEVLEGEVVGQVEPTVELDPFRAPDSLPWQVRGIWDIAVADLGGSGRMREAYLPQLIAYCEAVYLHKRASTALQDDDLTVFGAMGGRTVNPLIRIQKDAALVMLRFADSLGLTPTARMRLALEEVVGMSILQSLKSELDGR